MVVEKEVATSDSLRYDTFSQAIAPSIDLCITLGGDGTVLHLASLFVDGGPMPPVISFAMGSLGFLTPFTARVVRTAWWWWVLCPGAARRGAGWEGRGGNGGTRSGVVLHPPEPGDCSHAARSVPPHTVPFPAAAHCRLS